MDPTILVHERTPDRVAAFVREQRAAGWNGSPQQLSPRSPTWVWADSFPDADPNSFMLTAHQEVDGIVYCIGIGQRS